MPVHNVKCQNTECELFDKVTEVVTYKIGAPMPACEECGQQTLKTFEPTDKDKAFFESRKKKHTKVRNPFIKPGTVPRRAFDKNSTPSDLADDLRTGDIFL